MGGFDLTALGQPLLLLHLLHATYIAVKVLLYTRVMIRYCNSGQAGLQVTQEDPGGVGRTGTGRREGRTGTTLVLLCGRRQEKGNAMSIETQGDAARLLA